MPSPAAERAVPRRRGWGRIPHHALLGSATIAVLLVVVATGNVGQTYASWSDTTSKDVRTAQAGSITAVHTALPGIGATFSAGLTTKTDAVTVTNAGTVAADFTTSTTLADTSSPLQTAIAVTLWSTPTTSGCADPVNPVSGTWGAAALELTGPIAAGASLVVCVRTTISNVAAQTSGHSLTAALTTTLTRSSWTSTASTAVPQAYVDAAPTTPTGLTFSGTTATGTTLSWTASTDDVAVTGYDVYRGGVKVGDNVTGTTFTQTGLASATTYSFTVVARDGAGHVSPASAASSVTTPDTTAPGAPVLTLAGVAASSISLSWTESTDNVAVTNYLVYRGTSLIGTVNALTRTYTDNWPNLNPGSTYTYTVRARDAALNLSDASNAVAGTLPAPIVAPLTCTASATELTYTLTGPSNSGGYISVSLNDVRQYPDLDIRARTMPLSKETLRALAANGSVTVVITHMRPNGDQIILGTAVANVATDGTVSC